MTRDVAVVIAVRNGERHLDETLASVRGQTLKDIEIVVVDDGSTDGTAAIVDGHRAEDSRITRVAVTTGSAGAARNAGRRASTAPIVANLDQDDLAEPTRLERQATYLRAHPEVALVGSSWYIVDDSGRRRARIAPPSDPAVVTGRLRGGDLGNVAHATATFRRDALDRIGGYRELPGTSVEDIDLYSRIAEHHLVANVPEFLGSWRVHGDNASRDAAAMARWELLVEAAAGVRREGRADPLAERDLSLPPTDDELARLGVDSETTRARTFWWRLAWARLLLTVGETDAASRELVVAHAATSRESAALLATQAHVELSRDNWSGAAAAAARAAARSPRQAAQTLAHPVVGRVGHTVLQRLPKGRGTDLARSAVVSLLNRTGVQR